jgi:hypothetical protein
MKAYPNDDPDTAAKNACEDWKKEGWHIPPSSPGSNDDGDKNKSDKKKTAYFTQKYSKPNIVAEAVIIADIPYFAVARTADSDNGIRTVNITLEESIPNTNKTEYKPFEVEAYLNKPYSFKSNEEFDDTIERAKHETLDSLYKKVKTIWRRYIDADDFHISICAADTFFTYFQDKIGMTHYLFFVGNNNSGKSNNLTVLKHLAYRNFTSTDMTAANIYQFLGSGEEGQGTLCEDEADRIDEDRQKMAIHKNGYITGFPVSRIDTSFGRKQVKYNTFCFKGFAAESFPDPFVARGFNQRVLEMQCYYGDPEEDIAEVTNSAGDERLQRLVDELEETRNLLLAYRLLHFSDKIPDIKLNIKGREKQLFKPVIRIFQNTETLDLILPVISNYVIQKREANDATFNSFLYRIIVDMIADQKTSLLPSKLIWDYITSNLEGTVIPGRNQSYETTEFGTLSQKEVTQTLMHVFGAKNRKTGGTKHLAFDTGKLQRLGKVYDLSLKVEVIEESASKEVRDHRDLRDDIGADKEENFAILAKFHEGIEGEELPNDGGIYTPDGPNGPNGPLTQTQTFKCYHPGCDFLTDDVGEYEKHGAQNHYPNPLSYPSRAEIEQYKLTPQNKEWEV